jgi:hypothetical protein
MNQLQEIRSIPLKVVSINVNEYLLTLLNNNLNPVAGEKLITSLKSKITTSAKNPEAPHANKRIDNPSDLEK